MKDSVVFLDVDGVLNTRFSKSRCGYYIGIDDVRVQRLREIVEATNSRIVLCSSWKESWQKVRKEEQDELANYLDRKLKRQNLYVFDKTIDSVNNRGKGIKDWLSKHSEIVSWVVLDDEIFEDYEELGIIPHLVQTSYYSKDGGLQQEHIERAVEILNKVRL